MLGGRNQYDEKVRKNNAETEKRKYVITREKRFIEQQKESEKEVLSRSKTDTLTRRDGKIYSSLEDVKENIIGFLKLLDTLLYELFEWQERREDKSCGIV